VSIIGEADMDISIRQRRFKSPPTSEELAASVESLNTSIAVLDGIKDQLGAVAGEVGVLEAKIARLRGEIEALDDKRRELLAGIG
jgi:hypothetical protein